MRHPKRVAIIGADYPEYEKYCPNFVGMQSGLAKMGIDHCLFSCRPTLDLPSLLSYKPDLIVYGLIDMVRDVKSRMIIKSQLPEAKIVMWYGDYREEQHQADMSEIDMMFVSNDNQNRFYERVWKVPKCEFLPLGAEVKDVPHQSRFSFDFVFIGALNTGNIYGHRSTEILKLMQKGLKHLDASTETKPILRAKILKEMSSIYKNSKISLDVSHFTDIPGYTSNRFWIIPASGGVALTKRFPGCEDFYPEGTRIYFDTFDEALQLYDHYKKHPGQRAKIRAAGYAHAQSHTYDKRFAIMFERLYVENT